MTTSTQALQRMRDQLDESERVRADFWKRNAEKVCDVAAAMGTCIRGGGKILICGNGGSASDAQHFSGEMVGRFFKERRPLPAIALSTDTSVLTAVGNDYGYDYVFSRGVEAYGKPGDLLFAISTSGKSPNVMRAVEAAQRIGMKVVGMTGNTGGPLGEQCDWHLNVSLGKNSARIQEVHIQIIHLLVDLMDEFHLNS